MEIFEQVAAEVIHLADQARLNPLYTLALLIVLGVMIFTLRSLGRVKFTPKPSEPDLKPGVPVSTGEGGGLVDGNGNPATTDPENPGGGPTGGMG